MQAWKLELGPPLPTRPRGPAPGIPGLKTGIGLGDLPGQML